MRARCQQPDRMGGAQPPRASHHESIPRLAGAGLIMAARTDPDDVRAWARTHAELAAISIVSSLAEAFAIEPRPAAAIVSSRPHSHVPDSLEALRQGLHVLVEKPVS